MLTWQLADYYFYFFPFTFIWFQITKLETSLVLAYYNKPSRKPQEEFSVPFVIS